MLLKRLSRRTLLRGGGLAMALPALEAMQVRRAHGAASVTPRFIAFFYPNGTDPRLWKPEPGPLVAENLPACLVDLAGFSAEGMYPDGPSVLSDVCVVTGIDHGGVCTDIHSPAMALSAHKNPDGSNVPASATLDQVIAEQIAGDTAFRNLALSATNDSDIMQGNISFRDGGQPESAIRTPARAFETLFATFNPDPDQDLEQLRARKQSVLDFMREDAARLNLRLGASDRQRVDQYLESVLEVERQITVAPPIGCSVPAEPEGNGDWHQMMKAYMDLTAVAMSCDLTRVVTMQYSNSWGVHYSGWSLGTGDEAVKDWSDHFLSHKLDDQDRATDLDGLDRAEAQRIADARVVSTSRFKIRRFAYLINALKAISTPTGSVFDECLLLHTSENGDGDSHARRDMPIVLAGGLNGFETGRAVAAEGQPSGALHASILQRYGFDLDTYGDPAGSPIEGL